MIESNRMGNLRRFRDRESVWLTGYMEARRDAQADKRVRGVVLFVLGIGVGILVGVSICIWRHW